MIRRAFFAGVISSVSFASTGCLSRFPSSSTEEDDEEDDDEDDDEDENENEDEDEFNPGVEQITGVGEGSGISFEVEPEWDYEYLKESDSVRIEYDAGDSSTMAFDTFGTLRAADHSSDRLQRILEDNSLTGTGINAGWGRVELTEIDMSTGEAESLQEAVTRDAPMAPKVYHSYHYDRDGSLISEPTVPFQDIVESVPRLIEISIRFPEKKYTAVLPVVCSKEWEQNE